MTAVRTIILSHILQSVLQFVNFPYRYAIQLKLKLLTGLENIRRQNIQTSPEGKEG
jgi:hypothetical protein